MLRRTNFSPQRLAARAQAASELSLSRRFTLLVLLVAVLPAAGLYAGVRSRRHAFAAAELVRTGQLAAVKETRRQHDAVHDLATAAALAEQAQLNRQQWSAALAELRDRTPAGLWLTSVECGAGGLERTVKLAGRAAGAAAVGELAAGLNRSARFSQMVVLTCQPATGKDKALTEFSLSGVLRLQAEERR